MPILTENTKEIVLPFSKAKVIVSELNYGAFIRAREMSKGEENSTLVVATVMIKDWDFTDEKGQKLPITVENLKKLNPLDGDFLADKIAAQIDNQTAQKKTSK